MAKRNNSFHAEFTPAMDPTTPPTPTFSSAHRRASLLSTAKETTIKVRIKYVCNCVSRVRVRLCVRARVCVCVCVRACACACVRAGACLRMRLRIHRRSPVVLTSVCTLHPPPSTLHLVGDASSKKPQPEELLHDFASAAKNGDDRALVALLDGLHGAVPKGTEALHVNTQIRTERDATVRHLWAQS